MNRVLQLAYLGFEVSDLAAWESFGTGVLGMQAVRRSDDGSFGLRMDSWEQRFFITPGEADDLSLLAWLVPGSDAAEQLSRSLTDRGLEVARGTAEEAAARGVEGLFRYTDPAGIPSELVWGPRKADAEFRSEVLHSGFVAEEKGLGHLVISCTSQKDAHDFYSELMGLELSDHIRCEYFGHEVDIAFMHVHGRDSRHHSLAFGYDPKKRLHHFMVEVAGMDDVGLAMDRTMKSGLRIMQTLGRHPNDRMFSFYAKTPSGFQFELGWGGRSVDDETWEPTEYGMISEWGHHPPMMFAPPPKREGKAR